MNSMNAPNGHHDIDDGSVERFITGMRRRETARLGLLSFFLAYALAAAGFSLWIWTTRGADWAFLGPAVATEIVSLVLLAMLWRRSNRLRRLSRAAAAPTLRFLEAGLRETGQAIREQRVLLGAVLLVLTPLFLLSAWQLVADGRMSPADMGSLALLYLTGLLTVTGVTWHRLRRQLYPRQRLFRRLRDDYAG